MSVVPAVIPDEIFNISLAIILVYVGIHLYGAFKDRWLRRQGRRVTLEKGESHFTVTTNSKKLTDESVANLLADGYKVRK